VTTAHPLIVVAGVSGSGKSTVGEAIAEMLEIRFLDADSLHSPANVAKMAAGIPLTDDDRLPWLRAVGAALEAMAPSGGVVACSALRRAYREVILAEAPAAVFVMLAGSPELLAERMGHRTGHFMPTSLLASQLAILEPLATDEPGFTVDIGPAPADIAATIAARLAGFDVATP
jgi:gluconokinase